MPESPVTDDALVEGLTDVLASLSVNDPYAPPDAYARAVLAHLRERGVLAEWRTIETFSGQDGEVILTMHGDDLYPVCAFRIEGQWLRQTEGPEDVHGPGKWEPLYRAPTHYMPLPAAPTGEPK